MSRYTCMLFMLIRISNDRDWPMNEEKIFQIDDNRSSGIPLLVTSCKTINGASNFVRMDVLFSTIQS